MKKYLLLIVIVLFLVSSRSWGQNKTDISKTEQKIEKGKKDANKLQHKAEKKQRKMERKEKRMKRKERKRNVELRKIHKEEKKLDHLKNDSKNSAFLSPLINSRPEVILEFWNFEIGKYA